jgi:hypothetical protein
MIDEQVLRELQLFPDTNSSKVQVPGSKEYPIFKGARIKGPLTRESSGTFQNSMNT